MFETATYSSRRETLRNSVTNGCILLLGNDEVGMNYGANYYPYRQDSTFLYFTGIDRPGHMLLIDLEEGEEYLVGDNASTDDIVWTGPQTTVEQLAEASGIANTLTSSEFDLKIKDLLSKNLNINYLRPYRHKHIIYLASLFRADHGQVLSDFSQELTKAVVDMRSIKTEEEIEELHRAATITGKMHLKAMEVAQVGMTERQVMSSIMQVALEEGAGNSFPCIVSIHGEVLHNQHYGNTLNEGDLLLVDCGAESLRHYAGDMTRTFPVSKNFSDEQKAVYEIVLRAQKEAAHAVSPEVSYKDLHLGAARVIVEGLSGLGLMKGNVEDAVNEGAHALFFPHGLGHMMGLDVHDMENLGEEFTGYDDSVERSSQFGLNFLRLAKKLKPGYVLTVEPGIYFIPALIDIWQNQRKLEEFINYEALENYRSFGGIRIEDDLVVTENGSQLLGDPVAKEVADIEAIRGSSS